MSIVYQHRRKDTNEIFYIGWGKEKQRAYVKSGRNKHWHNIVNKCGYEVDVLINGCTEEIAKIVEVGMIAEYGRADLGLGSLTNQTNGGEGNPKLSPEKQKIKGEKISKKKKGVPNYKLRVPKSEETKEKLRQTQLGRKYSNEVNKKKANNNQWGEKNVNYGKHWITNGINNKLVKKEELVPKGYRTGRLSKHKHNKT
jgi:hypothetical protein